MKTEAHRLKADRDIGSRQRASHKIVGERRKFDPDVTAPNPVVPQPTATKRKRKKKARKADED